MAPIDKDENDNIVKFPESADSDLEDRPKLSYSNISFMTYPLDIPGVDGLYSGDINDMHLLPDGKILISHEKGISFFDEVNESYSHNQYISTLTGVNRINGIDNNSSGDIFMMTGGLMLILNNFNDYYK